MICLLGASGSGKSTIEKELVNRYGYEKVITYTTRSIRNGEVDGVDYHFISDEEFIKKQKEGFFAETTSYDTVFGIWRYGSALEDINDDKVIVINPEGFRQLQQNKKLNITSFLIKVNENSVIEKIKQRGDNEAEYKRRKNKDSIDFDGIESEVDFIINNFDYEMTPREIAKKISDRMDYNSIKNNKN